MYEANNNAIEQAKQVIELPMLRWELKDLKQDNQMLRNTLCAIKAGMEFQKLDKAERHDWIVAIDHVLAEVRDYGNDNDGLDGVA